MGVTLLRSCDFASIDCSNTDAEPLEVKIDTIVYRGEFCGDHRQEIANLLRELGMRAVASIHDGKRREILVTKSGAPFTASQARAWLIEEGVLGHSSGRVSKANLDLYAASH